MDGWWVGGWSKLHNIATLWLHMQGETWQIFSFSWRSKIEQEHKIRFNLWKLNRYLNIQVPAKNKFASHHSFPPCQQHFLIFFLIPHYQSPCSYFTIPTIPMLKLCLKISKASKGNPHTHTGLILPTQPVWLWLVYLKSVFVSLDMAGRSWYTRRPETYHWLLPNLTLSIMIIL